ncbi:MAG: tol-pal system YbgF family protein [Planctomycetota bacterium]
MAALLLLAAGTAAAPPRPAPECARTHEEAITLARTRGKLIFLTVIVDHDHENRAVIEQVFRDKEFLKIAEEFVCVYANNEDQHGKVKAKGPDGKQAIRCADCPSIECKDHMGLAQNWARGFFPESEAKTPIHFVVNAKEELVDTIMNGSFEQGFNHVAAGEVVARLKALLQKHGKGLSEEEYKRMEGLLSDAKAARARGLVTLELQKLLPVVALGKEIEGVKGAQARVAEIDKEAAKVLAEAEVLVASGKIEEALDALDKVAATYPGTLSAAAAEKDAKDLKGRTEVARLLKARDLFGEGLKFKEKGKPDLARKKFEACVRVYSDTKYGELAKKELAALPAGERK